MKIKLKNKDNPMDKLFCFNKKGFCQTIFDKINSGKQVEVEKIPKSALEYVEEVKLIKKKKKEGGTK